MRISRKAKKELFWIFLLIGCISFSCYMIFGEGGYLKLKQYRARLAELQAENALLQKNRLSLESQIDRLLNDPQEIERLAREQYHLARPGDIIVNVPRLR